MTTTGTGATAGYDYPLADEAIAQRPAMPRDSARLLDATGPELIHRRVRDLVDLVGPGDLIVVNDTKVLPARLQLAKPTGGAVEVFLLEPQPGAQGASVGDPGVASWHALVRPSRRVKPGTVLVDREGTPVVQVGQDHSEGRRTVVPAPGAAEGLIDLAHRIGQVPLPPYITADLDDPDRYQTVYARNERSVAAPTAGLHLTPEVLQACRASGAEIATVELAVGLGTFRPIMVENIADHRMHDEWFAVPPEVLQAARSANRVIAIGTTTVRALESAAALDAPTGRTELFIHPGFEFGLVDVLWTNFHQPRSSLLVMLAAFCGDRWREIYRVALAERYRFLSFGDAMIVTRHDLALAAS